LQKLISLGLVLFILKFAIQAVTGVYVPGIIIVCILGYLVVNDSGMLNKAKQFGEDFKGGLKDTK